MTIETTREPMKAGGQIRAIVPKDLDEVFKVANLILSANLAPDSFGRDGNKVATAIMKGLEIGLPPMAALQSICIVNGRPCLWGDGAVAVIWQSGKMESIKEWIEDDGGTKVAHCRVRRKGTDADAERTFSFEQAKMAGLLGKGPWRMYPDRMLQMRARAFAIRDTFPDVLMGTAIAEEVQDYPKDITTKVDTSFLNDDDDETHGDVTSDLVDESVERVETAARSTGIPQDKSQDNPSNEEDRDAFKRLVYSTLWSCPDANLVRTQAAKMREETDAAWKDAMINAGEAKRLSEFDEDGRKQNDLIMEELNKGRK